MPEPKRPLKVFLCHASTDKPKVRELYRYLRRRGINPWFDEEHLVGGQDWQVEIPKALATSDAIIICLTKNSVDKEGYIQKEIKFALDKALEMPEGRIFLIPVKFEECEVPFSLSRYQWVDLTVESGFAKMMKALKFRASQLERSTVEVSKKDIEEENLAREKKEREAAERAERERKEKELREKQNREAGEKTKRETDKKEDKPVAVKPRVGNQIAYWLGGFVVLVLGIVLLSSLINPSQTIEPTSTITSIPLPSTTITSKTPESQMTLTVTPLPTATAIGGGSGKIIFSTFTDGKNSIYTVNADGSELRKMSEGLYDDYIESLSPNGEKILFSSTRNNVRNFYVMDVDGENVINLTNFDSPVYAYRTDWSPDSTKIVYRTSESLVLTYIDGTRSIDLMNNIEDKYIIGWSPKGDKLLLQDWRRENGELRGEIYCVNADGTGVINLTDNKANDWFEDWLPDGEEIIFRSERDGNLEIYKVSLDGSGLENLTQSIGNDIYGALSLDKKDLFFSSDRSGNYDVYKMNLDNYSVEPLTSNPLDEYYKSYSSDGSKFIFEAGTGNYIDVYVADIDGSNPINLTNSIAEDRFVDWMPGGESILFTSNRNNNNDYFAVDLDGTNLINLTKHPEHDRFISWSPNKDKMLFSYEAVTPFWNKYGREVLDKEDILYTINIDGTKPVTLEFEGVSAWRAFWSLDANKLILSLRNGSTVITDVESSDVIKLEVDINGLFFLP
jgi:Tol biopolymer transport system component